MFVIDDELHCEHLGEFETREQAIEELRRLASIGWDVEPNLAPCTSWRTCGRKFAIVEFDTSSRPWRVLNRTSVLEISHKGVNWL